MRIAICEDEVTHANVLTRYIEQWVATQNFDVMIRLYESAEAFMKDFDNQVRYEVAFLDIQMPGMDGMSLAEYIRQWDKSMILVFVTNMTDSEGKGYEVDATRFLRKPIKERKVIEALTISRDICLKRQTGYFLVQDDLGTIRIPKTDILYFKTEGHYIHVYAQNMGSRAFPRFRGKLKDLKSEFPEPGFTLANRGTLLNMQFVNSIFKDEVLLSTGERITANKPYLQKLNKCFLAVHVEPLLYSTFK